MLAKVIDKQAPNPNRQIHWIVRIKTRAFQWTVIRETFVLRRGEEKLFSHYEVQFVSMRILQYLPEKRLYHHCGKADKIVIYDLFRDEDDDEEKRYLLVSFSIASSATSQADVSISNVRSDLHDAFFTSN